MKMRIEVGLLFALVIALGSRGASAEEVMTPVRAWDSPSAFGNKVTLSISGGSYLPQIDSDSTLHGQTPYANTFGQNGASPRMLFFQLEADRYLFRKYGSLGIGFTVAYGEKYAQAQVQGNDPAILIPSTNTKTSLQVIPLKLAAVYRLDYAALRWGFPIVPFGRVGVVYIPWMAKVGGTTEAVSAVGVAGNTGTGGGGRFGLNVAGGVSLMLDFLDPRLSRDFDVDLGVKHSYLFWEYTTDRVRMGGSGLNLSSATHLFGLAMDF